MRWSRTGAGQTDRRGLGAGVARGCGDDCEREQNSQPDALFFDILDKNEDIGSERNRFLRKMVRNDCNVVFLQESFTAENEFLRCRIEERKKMGA